MRTPAFLFALSALALGHITPGWAAQPSAATSSVPDVVPMRAGSKPHWITNLSGNWRVVRKPSGQLAALTSGSVGGVSGVVIRTSDDNGLTWGEVKLLLPMDPGVGAPDPLVDRKGELQLFFLKGREKKTDDDGSGMPMGIDIWHTHTTGGWKSAAPPVCIWRGYCGSMNCEMQLKNGRILFPFSFYSNSTWGHRGTGTEAFTYRGRGVCTLLYSDDDGDTWKLSPSRLRVSTPDLSTDEGSIEPVVTQLKDGRAWMLLRTQQGRFYESFSRDGALWSTPTPTRILSSDSPAGLTRLSDGRIVMLWNCSQRFPYAYGGRHVLHGAITDDDGKTWRGFREISRDPRRSEPPPPRGDHGTTYPIPTTVNNNIVITTDGLAAPRYELWLDPKWFYETTQREDFSHGLEEWSAFGVKGVDIVPDPLKAGAQALQIRKPSPDWPSAAVWNFPGGAAGHMRFQLLLKTGFSGGLIGLTDHFSVPFDTEDRFHNLFNLELSRSGGGWRIARRS